MALGRSPGPYPSRRQEAEATVRTSARWSSRLPAPPTNREGEGGSKREDVLLCVAVLGDASSGRFDDAGQAEVCRTRPEGRTHVTVLCHRLLGGPHPRSGTGRGKWKNPPRARPGPLARQVSRRRRCTLPGPRNSVPWTVTFSISGSTWSDRCCSWSSSGVFTSVLSRLSSLHVIRPSSPPVMPILNISHGNFQRP